MTKKTLLFWVDRVKVADLISNKPADCIMLHPCRTGFNETEYVHKHKEGLVKVTVTFMVELQGVKET